MKNFKKSIISVALLSVSALSFAQESSDHVTIGDIDTLEQRIAHESKLNTLAQIQLQRKEAEEALAEDKFRKILAQRESELRNEFSTREQELIATINELQGQIEVLNLRIEKSADDHANSVSGMANDIYVTAISGIGGNLVATVYHDEMIAKVSAGGNLSDTVFVKKVHDNGITVSDGDSEKFISLTNEKYAFSKTFNKDAAELLSSQAGGAGLRRR